jgi:hypothetical protein
MKVLSRKFSRLEKPASAEVVEREDARFRDARLGSEILYEDILQQGESG